MTRPLICFVFVLLFIACSPPKDSIKFNKETVIEEVKQMFNDYHNDIKKGGLTAEFKYLDNSKDFFWVPPGYDSALTYDSVKTILEQNADNFDAIEFHWKTLQIFPLTNEIANYSGIVVGIMEDTSGIKNTVKIIESGTIIKRQDGWKLLNGQSANLETGK
jgi:hypothetical protein